MKKKVILLISVFFIFSGIAFAQEAEFRSAVGNIDITVSGAEVVTVSFGGKLFVSDSQGNCLADFPISSTDLVFTSSPAVGDVDNDSEDEIAIAARDSSGNYYVKIYDKTATEVGSITLASANFSDPIVCDLDYDPRAEIAVTTLNNELLIYDRDDLGNWSLAQPAISLSGKADLAAANVDTDIYPEILAGYHDLARIDILNRSGEGIWSINSNWTTPAALSSRINAQDANSDGLKEIAFVTSDNSLHLFNTLGNELTGWPISLPSPSHFTPQFVNTDSDSNLEVAVELDNGQFLAWDLNAATVNSVPEKMRWNLDSNSLGYGANLIRSFLASNFIIDEYNDSQLQEVETGLLFHSQSVSLPDALAPVCVITSPTSDPNYETNLDAIDLSGTASDDTGVTSVDWETDRGESGPAIGTTSWNIFGITLYSGNNVITVTAHDAAGNTGSDIITVNYVEIPPPAAPVNLQATAGDTTVDLTWDASEGATHYRIYYGIQQGGPYGDLIEVDNITYSTVTGLQNGTTYYFVVTALNEQESESVYSNEASAAPAQIFQDKIDTIIGANYMPISIAVGYFSEDDIQDLAVANEGLDNVSILLGNGDGTFNKFNDYTVGTTPFSVAAGYFDNDDLQDLAVANYDSYNVSILMGNGNGSFDDAVNYDASNGPFCVAISDFDKKDGQDLAVANAAGNAVSIFLNNGDGSFYKFGDPLAGKSPYAIAVGDFNEDRNNDLAVANHNERDNTFSVLIGVGNGSFEPHVEYGIGNNSYSVSAGDFDEDGHLDLAIISDLGGTLLLYTGVGDGTFLATPLTYILGNRPTSIAMGDFNLDGHEDLAVAKNAGSSVSILLGNGHGAFTVAANYAAGNGSRTVVIGDFNADGPQDLAVANHEDGTISIFINQRHIAPVTPKNLEAEAGDAQVSLTWDAAAGATGYKVYFDTDSGEPYDNSIDVGNVTSCTITGLANDDTTYYFVVAAYNVYDESGYSNEANATPARSLQDGPWPMFRHDLEHTGRSQFLGPQSDNLKWQYSIGSFVYSSPAIASDGTIYVGSRGDGYLYAISDSGYYAEEKWRYGPCGAVSSSPAIASDGTIYFGSADDHLYALNPDGTEKWNYPTLGDVDSSPSIASDGTIYVGSRDGYLYAIIDRGDYAEEKWKIYIGHIGYSSPAIASDGTIYVGTEEFQNLYAITDAVDYAEVKDGWPFQTGDMIYSSPVISSDGTIYFGSCDNKFYALNPDGTEEWQPYVTGNNVESSPAIASDGTIYFGSADNKLYAYNPDTGLPKWNYETGGYVDSSPAIGSDGTIYAGSRDGYIYAITDLGDDREVKWSHSSLGQIISSPAISSSGRIYVVSAGGCLYAFGGMLGDIDNDGYITTHDALLCFQIALGKYEPNPGEEARADINRDGRVVTTDALWIFQEALGIPHYRLLGGKSKAGENDYLEVSLAPTAQKDVVQLTVKINNQSREVKDFQFDIIYTPTAFQYSDGNYTLGDLTSDWSPADDHLIKDGDARFAALNYNASIPAGSHGTIATFTFKALRNITSGAPDSIKLVNLDGGIFGFKVRQDSSVSSE